jgi:hypothetical protein
MHYMALYQKQKPRQYYTISIIDHFTPQGRKFHKKPKVYLPNGVEIFWLMYFCECQRVLSTFNAQLSSRNGREPNLDQIRYHKLGLSGALRYVAHMRYQAHARFSARSRKTTLRGAHFN